MSVLSSEHMALHFGWLLLAWGGHVNTLEEVYSRLGAARVHLLVQSRLT